MRNEKMERIINIEDSVIKHSHQDTVSHILVVHQWQVCLMHNLIRVWFSNSFLLPSSQCEAYSLHWYKHQCCFVRDYILQILFSSYLISLSFNQLFATKIRSISISSPCHFYFVLHCGLYSANIVLIVSHLLIIQSIISCKKLRSISISSPCHFYFVL